MIRAGAFEIRHLTALLMLCGLLGSAPGCGNPVGTCTPADPNCAAGGCAQTCPAGQYCSGGRCISPDYQCQHPGDECDPTAPSSEGFLCIDWDGQGLREAMCSTLCEPDGSCPAGSSCFVLQSRLDKPCEDVSECADGMYCVQGTCRFTACQPSECTGFVSGQHVCAQKYADHPDFADGAKCYELADQANFCFPAGTRQLGEQCVDIDTAQQDQNFAPTCAVGLGCVDGVCRTACEFDDDCRDGQTCVVGTDADIGFGVGFCAELCTPFEAGSCGEGKTCKPLGDDAGNCVPAGDKPAFSSCTPGAGECAEGTLCVEYPTGASAGGAGQPQARCHPICDLAAGPASEDGTITESAQAARDATCPQPPAAPASVRLAHLAETLGPVDIYLGDAQDPAASALAFGDAAPGGGAWRELPPGRYRTVVLPAGAPRTDRPLVQATVELASGAGKTIFVAPPAPTSSDDAQIAIVPGVAAADRATDRELRLVNLVADAPQLDVVVAPASADPFDTTNQTELAAGLDFGRAAAPASVPGVELRLLAFEAGADRSAADQVVIDTTVSASEDSLVVLRGTLDPDDFYDAGAVTVLALGEPASSRPAGPQFSCTALDGQAYGFCQQVCVGGPDDFGQGICQGDTMGCVPTDFPQRDEWMSLCAPVGEGGADSPCNPSRPYGQCAEGYYCAQFGTGAQAATGGQGGFCEPLCAVDGSDNPALGCQAEQSCQPVVYDGSYLVGQCGWACEPGDDFADASCPDGLKSCKPQASLREDTSGQTAPLVRQEQPFCSASGLTEAGQPCSGRDCVAGTECMYPRSVQTDLVSTILSPYFGGSAQIPTCTPQCDPFDADDAALRCADGETCLPNYPWSAEVGHCAPIEEDVAPMQPCTKPGLSCGEDSICVIYQGAQSCFRFCDYLGADAQGAYLQSTCPSSLACTPFVKDIGVCQTP